MGAPESKDANLSEQHSGCYYRSTLQCHTDKSHPNKLYGDPLKIVVSPQHFQDEVRLIILLSIAKNDFVYDHKKT